MAQGKLKFKNSASDKLASSKLNKTKKTSAAARKRGARYVAPKKAVTKKAEQVRKGFENAIKNNMELALRARATKEGAKPFHFTSSTAGVSNSTRRPKTATKSLQKSTNPTSNGIPVPSTSKQ